MPGNLHLKGQDGSDQVGECIKVSNDDAFAMARELALKEGILAGFPLVPMWWQHSNSPGGQRMPVKPFVTVACSTGERYLSTPLAEEARTKAAELPVQDPAA